MGMSSVRCVSGGQFSGHTILAHTRAMISGWEEVKDIEAVEDWEVKTKAARSA